MISNTKKRILGFLTLLILFAVFSDNSLAGNSTEFTCTLPWEGGGTFKITASGSTSSNSDSVTANGTVSTPGPAGYDVKMTLYKYQCICPGVEQETCDACSSTTVSGLNSLSADSTTTIGDVCATIQSDISLGGVVIIDNNDPNNRIGVSCVGNGVKSCSQSGQCVAGGGGGACSTDNDCKEPTPGFGCNDFQCVEGGDGRSCSVDGDCQPPNNNTISAIAGYFCPIETSIVECLTPEVTDPNPTPGNYYAPGTRVTLQGSGSSSAGFPLEYDWFTRGGGLVLTESGPTAQIELPSVYGASIGVGYVVEDGSGYFGRATCITTLNTPAESQPFCGDGQPNAGEGCDLGPLNDFPGSGCSADCRPNSCDLPCQTSIGCDGMVNDELLVCYDPDSGGYGSCRNRACIESDDCSCPDIVTKEGVIQVEVNNSDPSCVNLFQSLLGVSVTAANRADNYWVTSESGVGGMVTFQDLPLGSYTVSGSMSGFNSCGSVNVHLTSDESIAYVQLLLYSKSGTGEGGPSGDGFLSVSEGNMVSTGPYSLGMPEDSYVVAETGSSFGNSMDIAAGDFGPDPDLSLDGNVAGYPAYDLYGYPIDFDSLVRFLDAKNISYRTDSRIPNDSPNLDGFFVLKNDNLLFEEDPEPAPLPEVTFSLGPETCPEPPVDEPPVGDEVELDWVFKEGYSDPVLINSGEIVSYEVYVIDKSGCTGKVRLSCGASDGDFSQPQPRCTILPSGPIDLSGAPDGVASWTLTVDQTSGLFGDYIVTVGVESADDGSRLASDNFTLNIDRFIITGAVWVDGNVKIARGGEVFLDADHRWVDLLEGYPSAVLRWVSFD